MARRSELQSAIWRALASTAVFAQVLLLFAPLIEVRDSDGPSRVLAAGITAPDHATVAAERGHAPPHNATTCPACIAQSLHARVEAGVRLPTAVVDGRVPTDLRAAVPSSRDPPSIYLPRAPPIVS